MTFLTLKNPYFKKVNEVKIQFAKHFEKENYKHKKRGCFIPSFLHYRLTIRFYRVKIDCFLLAKSNQFKLF
jgi:hypothetical protein